MDTSFVAERSFGTDNLRVYRNGLVNSVFTIDITDVPLLIEVLKKWESSAREEIKSKKLSELVEENKRLSEVRDKVNSDLDDVQRKIMKLREE